MARLIARERVVFAMAGETVDCTRLEMLLRVLVTMAVDGDLRAMKLPL